MDMNEKNKVNQLNIYQKISKIQAEIGKIIRDEINRFQNYSYFEEFQVLSKLKPLLEKYNLILIPSDNTELGYVHEKIDKEHYIKYGKKIELIDTNNEKSLVFNYWAFGQNIDIAKAKGAAETYSMKYILTKLFLMPIKDKSDPDYEQQPEVTLREKKTTIRNEKVFICAECKNPNLQKNLKEVKGKMICSQCLNKGEWNQ